MRRNKMINITELRIGDIITKVDKYEGYKYSIAEGLDSLSGKIRHIEVYEDGGSNITTSSYEDMLPFPLSEELLKANGWQKSSVNGESVLFADFETISIGLRPSALFYDAFCPILFPDDSKRMHDAMFMYEIDSVHELQALLDMWKVRDMFKVRVKIKP